MRLAAIALFLALPTSLHASDCASEGQYFTHAYKAYNDCSAAGKGAAGCAGETSAYNAARAQLDGCYEQRRVRSQPSLESAASRDRDDDRGSWRESERDARRAYRPIALEPVRSPRR